MRITAVLFLLALSAPSISRAESSPADRIRERCVADAAKLLPQRGLGGGEANKIVAGPADFSEFPIEEPGCEKMTAYMSLPKGLDRSKKYALMFVFHGNGDRGKGRVGVVAQVTTERDPVIVIGVQYQELNADGTGKMGLPTLAKPDVVIKGCKWLLAKIMKEQPVDPERVFVGGFSWGTSWSSGWCEDEWTTNPDTFPFRACILYSSAGSTNRKGLPPIPWVSTVGELETKAAGNYEVLPNVRLYSNMLASWGFTVLHHEIPKMGHDVNYQCLQVTRDLINDLGGPGSLPYPPAGGAIEAKPDPLPFAKSEDKYVKEVTALLEADRWPEATARIAAIELDRKITLNDKKGVLALRSAMQKFAEPELARLDKILAEAAKAEKMPNPFQLRRQKAILEAYPKWPWAQKKIYPETLAKLGDEFPPIVRERDREKRLREAWALEATENRKDAKAIYEALAARETEDGGASAWPRAAKYRLQWWIDGKK